MTGTWVKKYINTSFNRYECNIALLSVLVEETRIFLINKFSALNILIVSLNYSYQPIFRVTLYVNTLHNCCEAEKNHQISKHSGFIEILSVEQLSTCIYGIIVNYFKEMIIHNENYEKKFCFHQLELISSQLKRLT